MSGTLLKSDATAVVWSEGDGYTILLPEGERNMPDAEVALIACGMRLQADPDFVSEMIRWMNKHRA